MRTRNEDMPRTQNWRRKPKIAKVCAESRSEYSEIWSEHDMFLDGAESQFEIRKDE